MATSVRDLMEPKSKAEIVETLKKYSLDSQLLKLVIEDDEVYNLVVEILSEMKVNLQYSVKLINDLVKVIRSF